MVYSDTLFSCYNRQQQQEVGSSGGDRLGLGKEAVAAAQRRQQRRLQDSELASMKEIMKLMVEVRKKEGRECVPVCPYQCVDSS